MSKLKLDVETLQVDSFEALPAPRRRGTVAAHLEPLNQDPFDDWGGGVGGGGANTVGTCVGPTYCCPETVTCPVIDTNYASRVVSRIVHPCTCQ